MALAEDIRRLLSGTLAELGAAHDYFTFSCLMWQELRKEVGLGKTFIYDNPDTGTCVNQDELVTRSAAYVQKHLASATFQQFVSVFEDFVFGLLRLWLSRPPAQPVEEAGRGRRHHRRAGQGGRPPLRGPRAERAEVRARRRLVRVPRPAREARRPTPDEIKASRDILVHNKGVVNRTYLAKSGKRARAADGEALDLPERYHRVSWAAVRKAAGDVAEAAAVRA